MRSANSIAKVEKVVKPPQKPTPKNKTHIPDLGFERNVDTTTPNKKDPAKFTRPVPNIELTPGQHHWKKRPTPYRSALPMAPPAATHIAATHPVFNRESPLFHSIVELKFNACSEVSVPHGSPPKLGSSPYLLGAMAHRNHSGPFISSFPQACTTDIARALHPHDRLAPFASLALTNQEQPNCIPD